MSNASPQITNIIQQDFNKVACDDEKKRQIQSSVQQLLPANEQVYIPSIVTATFENDIKLIWIYNQSQERKRLRSELVQCSLRLSLHQHIFFTALFYLQKLMSKIQDQKLYSKSLVIACLALARKYQKGRSPKLNKWKQKLIVELHKQQIQNLQNEIIMALEFELESMTRFNFMSDLFLAVNLDKKTRHFCSYLLDLSVYMGFQQLTENQRDNQYSEAEIGLAVVRLGCYFFAYDQLERLPIVQFRFSIDRISSCCQLIFQLLMNRKMQELKPIRHKYKKPRFMEVAKIQFLKIKQISSEKQGETGDEDEKQIAGIKLTQVQMSNILNFPQQVPV